MAEKLLNSHFALEKVVGEVRPVVNPIQHLSFSFFSIRLGCFNVIALFSYVKKWEGLILKIKKWRKTKF